MNKQEDNIEKKFLGFSIVEVMVVISLAMVAFVGIASFNLYMIFAANKNKEVSLADHLAVEAMEAVRSYRNANTWSIDGIGVLNTDTNYYPVLLSDTASSSWQMYEGMQVIEGFNRYMVFESVSRATSTDHIHQVYEAAYDDPNTRKVTVYVGRGSSTSTVAAYITSWLE